ncbi:MAG TPA: UPF0182 family protein [Gemmatimonadaceae bacterium]|nr:UPF0182 family protein [Gemmatimonadaceae bacterium]
MTFPPVGAARRPSASPGARRVLLGIVAIGFVALILVPWLASFATDWLWYSQIHFASVFIRSLRARVTLFAATAVLVFAFLYANIAWARRGMAGLPMLFENRTSGARIDVTRFVSRLLIVAVCIVAFIAGLVASAQWLTTLMALHAARVGSVDPLFGRDIGFYLFRLPAIADGLAMLGVICGLAFAMAVVLYGLGGALVFAPRRVTIQQHAARHIGALIALIFLVFAVQLWIVDSSQLLYSTTGPLVGASYTDVHVLLPGIRASAIAAVIAAGVVLYGAARHRLLGFTMIAVIGYAGLSVVLRGLAPAAEQRFVVAPNELARERPYLRDHIDATRRAWRIDSVARQSLSGEAQLTMADIQANAATIDNVRLWERDLLQQTLSQLQEIRTYYDFASVNDDRYVIDGRYRQVHLSARELNTRLLPTRNFINDRLTFTHGMGVAMAPVNQVTSEGLPVLFIKDLPPASTISINVTRPQIYYGQLTSSYVFVGTGQKEFDYPAGDRNVYTNYTGTGGVPIGSALRRLLYAWEFGSTDILLSSYLSGDARIMYRRNIMERARAALPFLSFDAEPYLVITAKGTLDWMLDAYTSSDRWPYSEPTQDGTNYMRNSVKVVIDAYNGTVDAYLVDPNDPIARTYAAIFGGVLKPLSAMPADLRAHMRYPGELFRRQTAMYATYHMVDPDAFYHREDQWQYPSVEPGTPNANPFMRHIILRLPGQSTEEFIYMTPFTPAGKDNLAAWMAARMDGSEYGKLVAYEFPKQSLVYGPKQIVNRINQETSISQQLTLWDQKGSTVIRGELLVIPIGESLIYVQPLYLRAEGGTIPELKRVVVAAGNDVAMGETLEEGLATLFGGGAAARASAAAADSAAATGATMPLTVAPASNALLSAAQQHYDRAIAAQRAGDWATYGREIDSLGAVLKRMSGGGRR